MVDKGEKLRELAYTSPPELSVKKSVPRLCKCYFNVISTKYIKRVNHLAPCWEKEKKHFGFKTHLCCRCRCRLLD